MYIADLTSFLHDTYVSATTNIWLFLTYGIYNMITWLYSVFTIIAKARFVTSAVIQDLTGRLYLIVGIVSLFLVAYSFLMVIVNPDNLTKGKYATSTMVKNIILAVVTITFVPTIFNFSYAVQKSILDKDVIGRIILDKGSATVDTGDDYMSDLSVSIFETSFYLTGSTDTVNPEYQKQYDTCAARSKMYSDIKFFSECIPLVQNGAVEYNPILAIVVGLFVIYVLGIYCIDMGLRAIKLVFLQIIAPIPCLLMIVPGQDKVFTSWVKEVVKTFIEVFIKILILTLGVYMIQLVTNIFANYTNEAFGPIKQLSVRVFVQLFIIFGILMFVNKAPKLIGDIFGIDLGAGLSLKKRMDEVKEGFKTVTTPVRALAGGINKVAGMGIGIGLSQAARIRANKDNNKKSTKLQTGLSILSGARTGWRGGISHAGSAYRNQQLMERSYALDSSKSRAAQFWGTVDANARGIIGRDSRYDDLVMSEAIKRDYNNALLTRQNQEIEAKTSEQIRSIDNQHRNTLEAHKSAQDSSSAFVTAVEKQTDKQDSNIRVSMEDMYNSYRADLENKIKFETNTGVKARLQRDLDNLDKAYNETSFIADNAVTEVVSPSGRVLTTKKGSGDFISADFNRFNMDAKVESIKKMDDSEISQDVRNALISMFNHGKDMANEQYVKDKDNWDTEVKVAFSNLSTSMSDKDVGTMKIARLDPVTGVPIKVDGKIVYDTKNVNIKVADKDAAGNVIGYHEESINKKFNDYSNGDYAGLLKLGKALKKAVNDETESKNTELTKTTVNISYTDSPGHRINESKSLYEWNSMHKANDNQIKDNNLAYEKFAESHKADKESIDALNEAKKANKNSGKK